MDLNDFGTESAQENRNGEARNYYRPPGYYAAEVANSPVQWKVVQKGVFEICGITAQKLPAGAVDALVHGAYVGVEFSLELVAHLLDRQPSSVGADLDAALEAGLIVPTSSAYRLAAVADAASAVSYRFAHDRVQQAEAAAGQLRARHVGKLASRELRQGRLLHHGSWQRPRRDAGCAVRPLPQ